MSAKANAAAVLWATSVAAAGAAAFVRWDALAHLRLLLASSTIAASCAVAVTVLAYELIEPLSDRIALLAASAGAVASVLAASGCLFQLAALGALRLHIEPLSLLCLNLQLRAGHAALAVLAPYGLLLAYAVFGRGDCHA